MHPAPPAGTDPFRAMTAAESADPVHAGPWGRFRPGRVQAALIWLARRSPLHRGRLRHLMTRAITALGTPLDVDFRGCHMRIEGRNNLIEYGLLLHPGYNGTEIDFLCNGLPAGGTAVDIGANVGLYALPLARRAGPGGRVIAIDANPGMVARLAFNAAASGLAGLDAVHAAVGDTEGRVDLSIRRDDVAIVAVREVEGGAVAMLPLARILSDAGIDRVDVLKIDIEGHEDKALVPWLDASPDDRLPARIVIERASPEADYPGCTAVFTRRGYVRVGQTRNNSLYRRG